jgi:hypothetical protein
LQSGSISFTVRTIAIETEADVTSPPSEEIGAAPTDDVSARQPRVRATSSETPRSASTASEAAMTTAEIPAVFSNERAGARQYYGQAHRANRARREPAPVGLRLLVWLLALVLVVLLVGLVVEKEQPDWLSFLRRTSPSAQVLSPQTPARATAPDTIATPGASGASALSFTVPYRSYEVVLTITAPCYVVEHNPASSPTIAFASTITPAMSPKVFSVTGSSTFVLAAQADSLAIRHADKVLDMIDKPKVGATYTFSTPSA